MSLTNVEPFQVIRDGITTAAPLPPPLLATIMTCPGVLSIKSLPY